MTKIREMNRQLAEEILNEKIPAEVLELYATPFQVSLEKIDSYNQNGFEKVEAVFPASVLAYIKKIVEAAVYLRKESDERELKDKTPYQQSFLQCGFLAFDYQPIRELVFSIRLASIAKSLLSCEHVRLWHDQALFKEPSGRGTDVHVDSSYWPINEPQKTGTIWLALNDVTKEKGCLFFYPGSQNFEREYVDIFNSPHVPENIQALEKVYQPLSAGDLTFHSGLTYHGAGPNITNDLREGMTIIYLADGCTFTSIDARNATHKSCIGLKDGERIDTIYTPIIF